MRRIIPLIASLFFILNCPAQSPLPVRGAQVDFGLGHYGGDAMTVYGGMDFCVYKDLTIGGRAEMAGRYMGLCGNFNWHMDDMLKLSPQWNVYAGANMGFYSYTSKDKSNSMDGFGVGFQGGGRYFLNDKWGISLEASTGKKVTGGHLGATLIL